MPNGPLSLPARLYLLSWDPASGESGAPAHLVRAGALTELAQRGLLVDDDGIATPADLDFGTGDAALDGLLELVRESLPHHWRAWVSLHARVTLDAVREQLAADGYLRAGKRRVLGLFPSVDYTLERTRAVDALREEARRVLTGPVPAGDVPERDAALVTLAAAAELRTLASPEERARHKERLTGLAGRSGPRQAIEGVLTALSSQAAPTGA
ncbi:GPP34 family phosphoprotein [Streptomyces sp. NPDC090106]|uniref:GOLPH3/VPS74 family protein n=1 Tax=Streptomyces sp. NPDC090106 TaxID=3365946 RepID=UPI003814966D